MARPQNRNSFHGSDRRFRTGLTLIEVLIAIVILAVALLALGEALTGGMVGVRRDGQRTIANQVAVSATEDIRARIAQDTQRNFDAASCSLDPVATVAGQAFSVSCTATPVLIDGSGDVVAVPSGAVGHAYEIVLAVTTPDGRTLTYRSLIVRRPDLPAPPPNESAGG